jgi:uncharacterized membrane protein (TIGR02234 family)
VSSRSLAFAALLVGAALALVASSQPWSQATSGPVSVPFTGNQVTGGLTQTLALTVLAGTLLLLALRVRGRQIVGALLSLLGVGLVLVGVLRRVPSQTLVRQQVLDISLLDAAALRATVWPWAYAGAGALVLAGGVLTVLRCGRWPARSDRFRRDAEPVATGGSEDPAALWKAMDAGVDPTTEAAESAGPEPTPADTSTPADPDVRKGV